MLASPPQNQLRTCYVQRISGGSKMTAGGFAWQPVRTFAAGAGFFSSLLASWPCNGLCPTSAAFFLQDQLSTRDTKRECVPNILPREHIGKCCPWDDTWKYCLQERIQEILSQGSISGNTVQGIISGNTVFRSISGNTVPRDYIRKYCPREHIRRYYPGKKDLRHPITSTKHCFTMRKDNKCEKENLKIWLEVL